MHDPGRTASGDSLVPRMDCGPCRVVADRRDHIRTTRVARIGSDIQSPSYFYQSSELDVRCQ